MIKIIKELMVEVTKPNIFQALVAKQYDMNTRFLKVTLVDCGTIINVPRTETTKVIINAERTDGQSKGFDGEINDDGTVTVPLHSWMLELEGTVICDISVIDTAVEDNKKLTTTSFTLIVEKAAYGGNDITSDPQYDILVELVGRVEKIEKSSAEATQHLANALKGSKRGQAISVDDVSPIEHSLGVKVESKNLLNINRELGTLSSGSANTSARNDFELDKYYTGFSRTNYYFPNFVNATIDNGVITMTAVANSWYGVAFPFKITPNTTYTLSGEFSENVLPDILYYDNNGNFIGKANEQGVYGNFSFTTPNNAVLATFTPVITESGTTATLSNIQIELGTTATPYTPYIADLGSVEVSKIGGNLLNGRTRAQQLTQYGLTMQYLADEDVYCFNGTTTATSRYNILAHDLYIDDYISLCVEVVSGECSSGTKVFFIGYKDTKDGNNSNWHSCSLDGAKTTTPTSKAYIGETWFYIASGITFNNFKVRISANKGKTQLPYEPYIEPQTAHATADGTVTGLKSISPNMTLLTDTDGAIINLDYNRDITIAFAKLEQAILSNT